MPTKSPYDSNVQQVHGEKTLVTDRDVDETARLIVVANGQRASVLIRNTSAAVVYLGADDTVTVDNGMPLAQNESLEDNHSYDAWWAICAAGAVADVRVIEVSY